ncbi:XRN 5'-3' exonuclease N-terminus protein [Toxoplasma gondii CAST]|uniref:XRN 5'-3' exonuclease N-terminus protein n=1 Tax=Toxoplasma gondii CAST TaxID=943122 RepID=A0A3R8A474_TOXGO|nr:XRN 5'-3' exonuclease N-terminus protein [Toxoplasma gondii CAST]
MADEEGPILPSTCPSSVRVSRDLDLSIPTCQDDGVSSLTTGTTPQGRTRRRWLLSASLDCSSLSSSSSSDSSSSSRWPASPPSFASVVRPRLTLSLSSLLQVSWCFFSFLSCFHVLAAPRQQWGRPSDRSSSFSLPNSSASSPSLASLLTVHSPARSACLPHVISSPHSLSSSLSSSPSSSRCASLSASSSSLFSGLSLPSYTYRFSSSSSSPQTSLSFLSSPSSFSSFVASSLSSYCSDRPAFDSRPVSSSSSSVGVFWPRAPGSTLASPAHSLRSNNSRISAFLASAGDTFAGGRPGGRDAKRYREWRGSCASVWLALGRCPPRSVSFFVQASALSSSPPLSASSLCSLSLRASPALASSPAFPALVSPSRLSRLRGGARSSALFGVPHLYKWLCRHFPSLKRTLHEFADLYVPPAPASSVSQTRESKDAQIGETETEIEGQKHPPAKWSPGRPPQSVSASPLSAERARDAQMELRAAVERAVQTAPRLVGRDRLRRRKGLAQALAPQPRGRRAAHVAAMQEVLRLKERELVATHRGKERQEPTLEVSRKKTAESSPGARASEDTRMRLPASSDSQAATPRDSAEKTAEKPLPAPLASDPRVLASSTTGAAVSRVSGVSQALPPTFPSSASSPATVARPVSLAQLRSRLPIDALFLDFNAIIHLCSHGHLPSTLPPPLMHCQPLLLQRVCAYLHRLVSLVRPRKLLVLTLDGVPPLAKVNQQRSRRFRQSRDDRLAVRLEDEEDEDEGDGRQGCRRAAQTPTLETDATLNAQETLRAEGREEGDGEGVRKLCGEASSDLFAAVAPPYLDTNCISPGTTFMTLCEQTLKKFIVHKLRTSPLWRNLQCVCLNTHSVPGEGEHKLLHLLRFGKWPESKSLPLTLQGAGPHAGDSRSFSPSSRGSAPCAPGAASRLGQKRSPPAVASLEEKTEKGENPTGLEATGPAHPGGLLHPRPEPPGLHILLPDREEESEAEMADSNGARPSVASPAPSVVSLQSNAPAGLLPRLPLKKAPAGALPLSRLEQRQREARPVFLSSFLHAKFSKRRPAESGDPGEAETQTPEQSSAPPLSSPSSSSDGDLPPSASAEEAEGFDGAQVALPGRICLYGMDADLLMLALSVHRPNLLILRERQASLERTRAQTHAEAVAKARVNPHRAVALFSDQGSLAPRGAQRARRGQRAPRRGPEREETEAPDPQAALLVPKRHDFLQYTPRDFEVVDVDVMRSELLSGLRRGIADADGFSSPFSETPGPFPPGRGEKPESSKGAQAVEPKAPGVVSFSQGEGRRGFADPRLLDPERLIDDFVFLSFFVGNDFLPGLPHLDIFQGGLATLVRSYTAALPALGGYLTLKTKINLERLRRLFQILALYEGPHFQRHLDPGLLRSISRAQAGLSGHGADGTRHDDLVEEAKRRISPLLSRVSRQPAQEVDCSDPHAVLYYTSKFPLATLLGRGDSRAKSGASPACPTSPSAAPLVPSLARGPWAVPFANFRAQLALDYVTGLFFLLRYYHTSKPCWSWFFPHEFAPLCSDLARLDPQALARAVALPSLREDFMFSPYAQLLAVLPASSAALLPRIYRHLPQTRDVADMFPDTFPVDSHPFHALRFDFKNILEGKQGRRAGTTHASAAGRNEASSLFFELQVPPALRDSELRGNQTCSSPSPPSTSSPSSPASPSVSGQCMDSREREAVALALDAHADPRFLASTLSAASAASLPSWLHRPILPPLDIPRLLEAARAAGKEAREERTEDGAGGQTAEKGRKAETETNSGVDSRGRAPETQIIFSLCKEHGQVIAEKRNERAKESKQKPAQRELAEEREQPERDQEREQAQERAARRQGREEQCESGEGEADDDDVHAEKAAKSEFEEDPLRTLWTLQDVLRNRVGKPVMFSPPSTSVFSGEKRRGRSTGGGSRGKRVSESNAGKVPGKSEKGAERGSRSTGFFGRERRGVNRRAEPKKVSTRKTEGEKERAGDSVDGDRRAKTGQGRTTQTTGTQKDKNLREPRCEEVFSERSKGSEGEGKGECEKASGSRGQRKELGRSGRRRSPKRKAPKSDEERKAPKSDEERKAPKSDEERKAPKSDEKRKAPKSAEENRGKVAFSGGKGQESQ